MSNNVLNRRQLLAWGSGTALALVLGQSTWAQTPLTADDFVALSARLTDHPARRLSARHASAYLDALVTENATGLGALAAGGKDAALEQRIISNWYTGLHDTAEGEKLVAYDDALLWDALDYTKPMGWCGGETGYWADAPEGEA